MSETQPPNPPAGWYADPGGAGQRYWDGTSWTEHVQGAAAATPPVYGAAVPEENRGNMLSILAIVFGAVSTLFCPILLGPAAIILAAVAMSKKERLAPIGLTVGILGMVVGFALGYLALVP